MSMASFAIKGSLSSALLTFVAPRVAEASLSGWGGYGDPGGSLYLDASSKVWVDAVTNSNATGRYTIPGYDVSKPWPGEPMDGWVIEVTAVDLLRKPVTKETFRHEDYPRYEVIGDDIKIIAPKSLYKPSTNASDAKAPIVNAHNDWVFCAWDWFNPSYSNQSQWRNPDNLDAKPDGSCEQWIPEPCIKAIEKQASTAYSMNYEPRGFYRSRYTCEDLDVPEECLGNTIENGEPLLPNFGVPIQYLNGSTTWQGGYLVDEDNRNETQLMWRAETQDFKPILTMFGRFQNNSASYDVEPGFAKLSCLRAADKGLKSDSDSEDSDSDSKTEDGGSAAPELVRSPKILMVVCLVMGLLLW